MKVIVAAILVLLLVCDRVREEPTLKRIPLTAIPPSKTTLEETIKPILPAEPPIPDEEEALLGKYEKGAGEEHILRNDLGVIPSGTPGKRKSLLYFVHFTDVHIADEESPLALAEVSYPLNGTLSVQTFDAMVRTVTDIANRGRNFDFILLTGDGIDGTQHNEARWLISILEGKPVNPDSGKDDDLIPGPYNDYNDPFLAWGMDIPWYIVVGNHDCLVRGTIWPQEHHKNLAVGDKSLLGSIDGATGELVGAGGYVPPDPERRLLTCSGFIEEFFDTESEPEGHGFTDDNLETGFGNYMVDFGVIRLIVMDTNCRSEVGGGLSAGCIYEEQFEWLKKELGKALEDKKLVIVSHHHYIGDIEHGELASLYPGSPVSADEYINTLKLYKNVILLVVGHGHDNKITPHPSEDGFGFWEIQTSSLQNWPQQTRIIEIVYNGGATGSVFTTMLDHNSPPGSLSDIARQLALKDAQGGKGKRHRGYPEDRNTELIFKIPEEMRDAIEAFKASSNIESLTTLKKFVPLSASNS